MSGTTINFCENIMLKSVEAPPIFLSFKKSTYFFTVFRIHFKFKRYLFNFDFTESSNLKTCSRWHGCWRSVVINSGGNLRTRGKPPTIGGQPLPCHMPTPGFDPGSQQWQASALTTALSGP